MLTKREYYDLLIQSAHDGTFPSMINKSCAYRGQREGSKCAIGLLLTDEEARRIPNTVGLSQIIREYPELDLEHRVSGLTKKDLIDIQEIHDYTAFSIHTTPSNFAEKFVKRLNSLPCFAEFVQEKVS